MKKIINPWEGLDGYMCFGCAPNNPLGLHMEFFEDGDDIVAHGLIIFFISRKQYLYVFCCSKLTKKPALERNRLYK